MLHGCFTDGDGSPTGDGRGDPVGVGDPHGGRVVAVAERAVVVEPAPVEEGQPVAVEFDAEAGGVGDGDLAAVEGEAFGEDVLGLPG